MEQRRDPASLRATADGARRAGLEVGFVPTMGALHEGHAGLLRRARAEQGYVVASVFVNPTQFNDAADLEAYPRTVEADLELLEASGVDLAYLPGVADVYPEGLEALGEVALPAVALPLEGQARPGHFAGVVAVVGRLLEAVGPCTLYLGEKDYQQLAVLRAAFDGKGGVEVVGCPTSREADGLARSSRNARLSPTARAQAAAMPVALARGAAVLEAGGSDAEAATAMGEVLVAAGSERVEYAVVVDAEGLEARSLDQVTPARLLLAAWFGGVRLIDNADPRELPLGT